MILLAIIFACAIYTSVLFGTEFIDGIKNKHNKGFFLYLLIPVLLWALFYYSQHYIEP